MSRQVDTCVTQNILKDVKFWYGLNFDLKESNWASNISESVCFQYVSDTFHACVSVTAMHTKCVLICLSKSPIVTQSLLLDGNGKKNIFLL